MTFLTVHLLRPPASDASPTQLAQECVALLGQLYDLMWEEATLRHDATPPSKGAPDPFVLVERISDAAHGLRTIACERKILTPEHYLALSRAESDASADPELGPKRFGMGYTSGQLCAQRFDALAARIGRLPAMQPLLERTRVELLDCGMAREALGSASLPLRRQGSSHPSQRTRLRA